MVQTGHTLPFVHLRVQSGYSIGVGVSTPREICAHAARTGFNAVALTDVGGTWGWAEFHKAAQSYGIKPIYGVTLGVVLPGEGGVVPCVLLALDRTGLENVAALAGLAADRDDGDPFVPVSAIGEHSDGVVCVIGAPEPDDDGDSFDFAQPEPDDDGNSTDVTQPQPDFRGCLVQLFERFGDRLFYGLAPGFDEGDIWIQDAYDLGIAAVVAQDVRYVGFKHYSLVTSDRGAGEREADERRPGHDEAVDQYRFLSVNEVAPWYGRYAAAYANASMIASLVHPDLLDGLDTAVPASDAPLLLNGGAGGEYQSALEEKLAELCDRRFAEAPDEERRRYRELLEGELESIRETGTAEPFLRFHEIVSKLRRLDIPLGPSTGLRHQSLTGYLLGITTFNPYEVDEQFVSDLGGDPNGRRILDLQIASADRDATVSVLRRLFDGVGVGYVPSVEHVTPLRALKAAGRDVGIADADFAEMVKIAGEHPGVPLKKLCEENRQIGRLYRRSPAVRELVSAAATIEGLPINFVKSRRTLLVSPRCLRHYFGHTIHPDTGELFFQATRDAFPMESVFRVDLSTLRALGVCARVAGFTTEEQEEEGWEWTRPDGPAQDVADEFEHVEKGDVDGVFLLESPLTHRLAVEFGVTSFGDLTRFLAIMRHRRGDMSFPARVEAYGKGPASKEKPDPAISFLLNETNGWVLFDDQLREIISVLTALPGNEAASLLRRFKRRDSGGLATLRHDFMSRTVETEVPLDEAEAWFKRLRYLAGRTLDRQHLIADALLVYRMLRIKHHDRAAFFAALLDEHRGHGARFDVYFGVVQAEGLLLAPGVNRSGRGYLPEKGLIRVPLTKIKGMGIEAVEAILTARGGGQFENLEDLLRRTSEVVTNKEIEALVASGAVDTVGGLGKPVEVPETVEEAGGHPADSGQNGQLSIPFGGEKEPHTDDDSARNSEPPLNKKDGNIRAGYRVVHTLAEFYPHPSGARVELAGNIRDLHSFNTSSDYETCFFVLFDASASVPVFAQLGRIGWSGEPPADGDRVHVRGVVRIRDRRMVLDAVEVLAEGGAISHGETSTDEPPAGDS